MHKKKIDMEEINSPSSNNNKQLPPDNYLAWAIVVTLLCCWPFGIPALVYSIKVDTLWREGHHEAAIQAANDAKKWTKVAAIVGGVFWVLYLIFIIIYFAAIAFGVSEFLD